MILIAKVMTMSWQLLTNHEKSGSVMLDKIRLDKIINTQPRSSSYIYLLLLKGRAVSFCDMYDFGTVESATPLAGGVS